MSCNWPRFTIQELIDSQVITVQKDGNHGSNYPRASEFGDKGVAFLTAKLLDDAGNIDFAQAPRLSEEKAAKFKFGFIEKDDVLLSHNATVGRVAIVPNYGEKVLIGTSLTHYRLNSEKLLPQYLAAFFTSKDFQNQLAAVMSQTTRNQVPITAQRKLEVVIPPIKIQEQLTRISGSIIEKISLNTQTNQTLEEMAQAIFKSWFVDFDPVKAMMNGEQPEGMDAATASLFPDKLVESELGLIPEGWEVGDLSDLMDFNPKRTLKKGTIAPYLDMKNMPTSGHLALDIYDREMGSGTKFKNGDSLLARITPCLENGKTAYVDFLEDEQIGWGSTEYIVMSSKSDSYKYFSYYMARFEPFRKFAIQSMTGTSGRQRAQAQTVQTMPFAIPPISILEKFDAFIAPNMQMIKSHGSENRTLSNLRDTLLPKLLSGEIELNANADDSSEANSNVDAEEVDYFIKSLLKELKEEDKLSLIYDSLYLEPIVTWMDNKDALPYSIVSKIEDALESVNRLIPRYYDYNGFSGKQGEIDENIEVFWGYGEPVYVREVTKYCMYIARKSYLQKMSSTLASGSIPLTDNSNYALKISEIDVEKMGCDISNWFGDVRLINSEEPYVKMTRDSDGWILTFPEMGPRNEYSDCVKIGYESILHIVAEAFACSVSVVEI